MKKNPCFLALFTVQRTVVLARRCMRYRHAFRPTILALLRKTFCPLGLVLSAFPQSAS